MYIFIYLYFSFELFMLHQKTVNKNLTINNDGFPMKWCAATISELDMMMKWFRPKWIQNGFQVNWLHRMDFGVPRPVLCAKDAQTLWLALKQLLTTDSIESFIAFRCVLACRCLAAIHQNVDWLIRTNWRKIRFPTTHAHMEIHSFRPNDRVSIISSLAVGAVTFRWNALHVGHLAIEWIWLKYIQWNCLMHCLALLFCFFAFLHFCFFFNKILS